MNSEVVNSLKWNNREIIYISNIRCLFLGLPYSIHKYVVFDPEIFRTSSRTQSLNLLNSIPKSVEFNPQDPRTLFSSLRT